MPEAVELALALITPDELSTAVTELKARVAELVEDEQVRLTTVSLFEMVRLLSPMFRKVLDGTLPKLTVVSRMRQVPLVTVPPIVIVPTFVPFVAPNA